MPDITMCTSENCPVKDKCYRTQATPGTWQSWANFEYSCNEENGFEEFLICYEGRNKKYESN